MGMELLFLLLPIAALSGWWLGKKGPDAPGKGKALDLSANYLKGLNYVINDQADKAIEVFVNMVAVDSDTIETHFALASLFRRRGEVERAIRIHQNLIARPTLTLHDRNEALYELSRDYFTAGLFDRAESLALELSSEPDVGPRALRQLIDIYQQERDWEKAITAADRLWASSKERIDPLVAHFHCEIAEKALETGNQARAGSHIGRALAVNKSSVRASLLEARIALADGRAERALAALARVERQDARFLSETIDLALQAFTCSHREADAESYFRELLGRHAVTSAMLALSRLVRQRSNIDAERLVAEFVRNHPSIWGVAELVDLRLTLSSTNTELQAVNELLRRLVESKPRYRCQSCGFSGRTLYWLCPGCKKWDTTRPIYGIEGE